jgi:hypothetical protein
MYVFTSSTLGFMDFWSRKIYYMGTVAGGGRGESEGGGYPKS